MKFDHVVSVVTDCINFIKKRDLNNLKFKHVVKDFDADYNDLLYFCAVVVVYPTPSKGWGHGGRPWSPRSRATPQGLDQRSYRDRESPKSERRKESVAGQCRMR